MEGKGWLKIWLKQKGWLKIWLKKGVAQKIAVKNYSVENMAVNNLQVCNMAEMKYKVKNKLPFQNMATNVDTSNRSHKQTLTNDKYTGHWHRLVLNRNILEIRVSCTK